MHHELMEYFDVVNTDDHVISTLPRPEIYAQKLLHRIVHVLVFNDKGEMALQLRSRQVSYCPNHWCTAAGGHVRAGESYEEAARREYQEELGVGGQLEFFSKNIFHAHDGLEKFVAAFRTVHNGPFAPDAAEVEDVRFFALEEIKEMIGKGEKMHPELLFLFRKYFS